MSKAYKFGLAVSENDDYTVQENDSSQQEAADISTEFSNNDDADLDLSSEWMLVDWCDETRTNSNDKNDKVAMRLSCFAHSLQLSVRDGLKDSPYLVKSLSKCIKLARRSHKSTKIADLLDDIEKTINRSNVTCWSSEYLLIKSIIALGKKQLMKLPMSSMIMK